MNEGIGNLEILRKLDSSDLLRVVAVLVLAWLVAAVLRWALRSIAEKVTPRLRLPILRVVPVVRLMIGIGAAAVIVSVIVRPSFQNVVALLASVSLAVAFALKDYASALAAGLVTVLENAYQPGDWIEIDGVYGEVRFIGARAVHIVTTDDNVVMIPHYQFWSKKISNATSGSRSLLCVANFYLHPDHEGQAVMRCLEEIGETSSWRKPETKLSVIVEEKPWGTHYKLKAYVKESREQFKFITDLTIRGKEALRAMNIRFANVLPVIEAGKK
ncbi:MAG TPA: mechanosensitive ion channel domain-containing protein [Usitatibacteraceae bacterium]